MSTEKSLLKFTTTGSVDDGKSTLIGRLLYETHCIFEDQYDAVKKTSEKKGKDEVDVSLLLDGLAAEREQGITIDVAYRYFATNNRKFIIADTPGHEQYTRNMVTGASNADLAIILVDARNGVLTQSRRHGFLLSLLQVPHLIVAVNKMDLVDYSEAVYDRIARDYTQFSEKLDIHDITFIPVSAQYGDNVTTKSNHMPWYDGPSLLKLLETVNVSADRNLVDFRFPVQYILRPDLDFRGFAGTIASGAVTPGEAIVALPSGKETTIKSVVVDREEVDSAEAGTAAVLTLNDEIDVSRGDMLVRKHNIPYVDKRFDTMLCWMDDVPFDPAKQYLLKHTTRKVRCVVKKLNYVVDVNTLHRRQETVLRLNDIARAEIRTLNPLFFDPYNRIRETGSFILIDPVSNNTVAAGMIRGEVREAQDVRPPEVEASSETISPNVFWESGGIPTRKWEERNGHKAAVLWLTGLSGSGKSAVAKELLMELFNRNVRVQLLDGDNLRHGLNGDLGFSPEERSENIRRTGEVAKLFYAQGNIVLCPFISPYKEDRGFVRSILPAGRFIEIHIECPVEVCEKRDPKGLYQKARSGEIKNFTGVSAPYEVPDAAELTLDTTALETRQSVQRIIHYLKAEGILA